MSAYQQIAYQPRDLLVTDFTLIKKETACVAGVDVRTGQMIRPNYWRYGNQRWMPFECNECLAKGIMIGAHIRGTFGLSNAIKVPHDAEDAYYQQQDLTFVAPCADVYTREIIPFLRQTAMKSIENGFSIPNQIDDLRENKKIVVATCHASRSIITIKVQNLLLFTQQVEGRTKIRAKFLDGNNRQYELTVTDMRFHKKEFHVSGWEEPKAVTRWASDTTDEVFLRIGMTRPPDFDPLHYYLQVDGVHCFSRTQPTTPIIPYFNT